MFGLLGCQRAAHELATLLAVGMLSAMHGSALGAACTKDCKTTVYVTTSGSTCTYKWDTESYQVKLGLQLVMRWELDDKSYSFGGTSGVALVESANAVHDGDELDNARTENAGTVFRWTAVGKSTTPETFKLEMTIQKVENGSIVRTCTRRPQSDYTIELTS